MSTCVCPSHQMSPLPGHRTGAHLLHQRLQLDEHEQVRQSQPLTHLSTFCLPLLMISSKERYPFYNYHILNMILNQKISNGSQIPPRYVLSAKCTSIVSSISSTSFCTAMMSDKRNLKKRTLSFREKQFMIYGYGGS